MSRKERLMKFMEEKKKDKKNTMKIGKLSDFNVSGLGATTPTLHLPLDAICSGVPKGVIMEFWGDESAGKTTTLGKVLENWKIAHKYNDNLKDLEKSVLYIDSEGTFNHKFFQRFPHLEEDDVLFYKESVIEEIWNKLEELVAADAIDLVILDSLTATQTNEEENKNIDQYTMASLTKKVGWLVKKFYKLAEESGLTFIIINSSYTDVNSGGMFSAPKQIIRGGKQLALGKSVSIQIKKSYSKDNKTTEKVNGEDIMTEHTVKYQAVKNKIGVPMKEAVTFLNTNPEQNMTFNYAKDVLQYASQFGFIKKGGAWFTALDGKGNELYKCQGGNKMADYIQLNPSFYIKLKLLIYSKLYMPYEFYYHFDTLRNMLYAEFTAMQELLRRELSFQDQLDEDDYEMFEGFIGQQTDITNLKISDVLEAGDIRKALFELEKFYGKEKTDKITVKNSNPVKFKEDHENILSLNETNDEVEKIEE